MSLREAIDNLEQFLKENPSLEEQQYKLEEALMRLPTIEARMTYLQEELLDKSDELQKQLYKLNDIAAKVSQK